ncbi:PEP-CTERM sorting domain-containing protein [Photobacterium japonica]|uniref:PEP-CTERM sorting domain-containing protein n=1 Tax=Photobacterium japonica TaxID=2910235 RepID=UPI003D0BF6F4
MRVVSPLSLLALCGSMVATSVSAGEIIITNWQDTSAPTAGYTYSINDNTAGRFTFNISVPQTDADILAVAFNTDGATEYTSANLDVMNFSAIARSGGPAVAPTNTFFNTSNCGAGCNFNGSVDPAPFDVILRVGNQGSPLTDWYYDVSFDIADLGLSLNDFIAVGIRGQSVLGSGSDKAFQEIPECPNTRAGVTRDCPPSGPPQVPEPASFGLFLMGMAGVGWGIRRQRKQSV